MHLNLISIAFNLNVKHVKSKKEMRDLKKMNLNMKINLLTLRITGKIMLTCEAIMALKSDICEIH